MSIGRVQIGVYPLFWEDTAQVLTHNIITKRILYQSLPIGFPCALFRGVIAPGDSPLTVRTVSTSSTDHSSYGSAHALLVKTTFLAFSISHSLQEKELRKGRISHALSPLRYT